MNRLYPVAVLAAVVTATAFQTPTFRSSTRLVQVNVIAVDKDGKPVADLRKEEFTVFEDGQPQTTSVFVAEQARPIKPPVLPPNQFSNQLPSTSLTRSGYTMILIDWLNSSMNNRITSQKQVLKLLQQVEPNDLIALCVLDRDLRVLHDFTADRAALVKKLSETYAGLAEGPPGEKAGIAEFPIYPKIELEHSPVFDVSERRNQRSLEIQRNLSTFSAIEQVASYLGTTPGRKSMIWVTSGFSSAMGFDGERTDDKDAWSSAMSDDRRAFTPEMTRVIRRLNDANIAVYPVDARGLISDPDGAKAGRAYTNLVGMKEIAERTGGRAYYNANDLDNAIRSALDDSRISYTLGYYSTNSKNDGKYRNVSVKVNRPGVTLRYRTGYEAEKESKNKTAPKMDLQQVFGSPLDATGLPLSARAFRVGGGKLDVWLRINPATLTMRHEFGHRRGGLSVFYTFRTGDTTGKIQIFSATNKLDMPDELYPKFAEQGLRNYRKQLPIPEKATSIRLAVRDEESGAVGSVTIPLAAVH